MVRGDAPRTWPVEDDDLVWPPWVTWLRAALVGAVVVGVALEPGVERRGAVVALTLVAASGWFLELVGTRLPPALHAALALGPVAVLNLGVDRLGFEGHGVELTLMIVVFLAGEVVATATPRLAVTVVSAALALTLLSHRSVHPGETPIWAVAVALAAGCGFFIRSLYTALLELKSTQAELASTAATEERHRIAREVHDVIAHSLTVAMLHITAARLAVNRGDLDDASTALEEAERAGRQSLTDVRRTVGLLRQEDAVARPAPLASDLTALVDGYRAAGLPVDLTVHGDLTRVTPQVGLALYRIVQESLANVARHTPGASAEVTVAARDPLEVRVRSAGGRRPTEPGRGSGLTGMRERAEALGGSCRAGPDRDGWLVEAVLPLAGAEVLP